MTGNSSVEDIQWLLHCLGVTENYTGFFPTVYAIQLAIRDPDRLALVTKLIYPDVARQFGTNWKAVERNMRTMVSAIWANNPLLLCELAGRQLSGKPKNSTFLAIVAGSCGKQWAKKFEELGDT